MKTQHSIKREKHWEVGFWLIFDQNGGVRLTRGEPGLSRDERAMAMTVNAPHALFKTPSLRATIDIQAPEPAVATIDLTAAADALKQALGCDIEVRLTESA